MARKPRYYISRAFYHVMLRGNNKQKIFFNDMDRCCICFLLQEGMEKYDHCIHAFCLMDNHIHLLIQVKNTPISKIIHNLAFRYSQKLNKRYQRVGHLFQGRFKAILIDENTYFLKLLRYIHNNPVCSRFVESANDYIWSSHNAYLGDQDIAWLTTDYGLNKFGANINDARKMYNAFVLEKTSEEEMDIIRKQFQDGDVLGDDNFLETIKKTQKILDEPKMPLSIIIEEACEIFGINKNLLLSASRARELSIPRGAIALHVQEKGISLEELARLLKKDASSLSRLRDKFLIEQHSSNDLQQKMEKLRQGVGRK